MKFRLNGKKTVIASCIYEDDAISIANKYLKVAQ